MTGVDSYYVTAKVRKTHGVLGRPVTASDAPEVFTPYDARRMSRDAAQESAAVSNDRYRPRLHGCTYVAVRVEPAGQPGKVRNLDRAGEPR